MAKFQVLLDTNIYRRSAKRTDLPFQALERLCTSEIVTLHLPYVVEREFQTQLVAEYAREIEAISSAINSLLRKGVPAEQAPRFTAMSESLKGMTPGILKEAETAIQIWAEEIGAKRHPISEKQALAAMESYFQGTPPLKKAKVRDDIPDAFVFQTLLSIEGDGVIFVTNDEKLSESAGALPGVTVFRELAEFIESAPVQAEILELDVIENLGEIAGAIRTFEEETQEIFDQIKRASVDALSWQKIHSNSIPDDNNEATITGTYEPDQVDLQFEDLSYFGNGEFGLPFSFATRVMAHYYLFKSDLYALDPDNLPSLSDHNDHYYEAEDEFDVVVRGLLKLSIPIAELKNISAEGIKDSLEIEIDSIDEITLASDE